MSFLVKLPIEHYAPDAFAQFAGGPAFEIGNARAMAWMCQLAYETDEPNKIAKILADRGFTLVDGGVLIREAKTVLPMADTHCFLARHNQTGTAIVAFAGTDPLSLANWVSDFNAHLDRKTAAAEGYQGAADAVTNDLRQLLARFVPQGGKVIVTGHSLGGAIAALIAARIDAEHPGSVTRSTPTACRGRGARGWSIPITLPAWGCARTGWCTARTSCRRWRRARSASCISAGLSPASGRQNSSPPIWRPIRVRTFHRSAT